MCGCFAGDSLVDSPVLLTTTALNLCDQTVAIRTNEYGSRSVNKSSPFILIPT